MRWEGALKDDEALAFSPIRYPGTSLSRDLSPVRELIVPQPLEVRRRAGVLRADVLQAGRMNLQAPEIVFGIRIFMWTVTDRDHSFGLD